MTQTFAPGALCCAYPPCYASNDHAADFIAEIGVRRIFTPICKDALASVKTEHAVIADYNTQEGGYIFNRPTNKA